MHLRHLKISAMPGIEPGFTFEPESDHVNIVTGPNAIGKSSLSRALKYLLGGIDPRRDPPALNLEAEFVSGEVRWTVRRTGRQVDWMRDGESATPPSIPSADQFGLYRLSMESLLVDDDSDQVLAIELWRAMRGGFDLHDARGDMGHIGPRFARTEERKLQARRKVLTEVQGEYEELQFLEAQLPSLATRIEQSKEASVRRAHLKTALELHEATRRRGECRAALKGFPAGLDKLHGGELNRLDDLEGKTAGLGEQLQEAERTLAASAQELESTGLVDARPDPEHVSQIRELLRRIGLDAIKRDNAQVALVQAEAGLEIARAELGGGEQFPRLDADSLERARGIIEPLGECQVRRSVLQQRLDMSGIPANESEIEQLRDGAGALRAWLAVQAGGGYEDGEARARAVRRTTWVALVLAGITALTAIVGGATWVSAGALATAVALCVSLYFARRVGSGATALGAAAIRRFEETGLESPAEWSARTVRQHLRRNVEARLDELRLQRERAEGATTLRADLKEVESTIDKLQAQKSALAMEIGIDPSLSGAPFLRFLAVTEKWDAARTDHAIKEAALQEIDARIADDVVRVRALLAPWRPAGVPRLEDSAATADLDGLRIAFEALDERLSKAKDAEGAIKSAQASVKSLKDQILGVESDKAGIFARVGLKRGARDDLAQRIDQLEAWQEARKTLTLATNEEERLRGLICVERSLIEAVEDGAVHDLQDELQAAAGIADKHTELIEEQTRINTLLDSARKSHRLEQAAAELGQAEETLKDKRAEALLLAATEVLLNEVENAFKTEREPDLLRRARERFEHVTAHDFTIELSDKTGFTARDLRKGETRTPTELSSGTRMQLLLALRLAWTEDREQGGESLPLFLDEALTTSDESRFAVMARTLSKLSEDEGRQVFYLSARRHEAALWEQATGLVPPVIDLAAVRFADATPLSELPPFEPLPTLPPPNGQDAETYASSIAVPAVDPRGHTGGIHMFHLLRDDLNLLHSLLDTWRVGTLGQLESLLSSDAVGNAISDGQTRQRLAQRCQSARMWAALWRQGRGRPVDRADLDHCPAVSETFLDRAAALAKDLEGNGEALVRALRDGHLKGFFRSKIDDLDDWLADKGYIDDAVVLGHEERRRLTLQGVAPATQADAIDVNRVVDWMESAVVS